MALSEARILEVESVAFVENRDGILESTESGISWSLYTAGDSRGFNLEFDGEDGEMKIQTKHAELKGRIRNFLDKSAVVDAGRLGQRIEVGKTPAMDGPWEARFEYIDNDAPSGLNSVLGTGGSGEPGKSLEQSRLGESGIKGSWAGESTGVPFHSTEFQDSRIQ